MNCQHHALTIRSNSQLHFYVVTFKEALKMVRCDCCQEGFEKMRQYALQNFVQFWFSLSSCVEWCAANTTERRDAIQMALGKLEMWVHKNFIKLNKSRQGAATGLRQSQISRPGKLMKSPAKRGLGAVRGESWMCPGAEIPQADTPV